MYQTRSSTTPLKSWAFTQLPGSGQMIELSPDCSLVLIGAIGGGGGGGSGRAASSGAVFGGGGGGMGARASMLIPRAFLPSFLVAFDNGTTGAGGAAVSVTSDGTTGSVGKEFYLMTGHTLSSRVLVYGQGGNGGVGGTSVLGTGGSGAGHTTPEYTVLGHFVTSTGNSGASGVSNGTATAVAFVSNAGLPGAGAGGVSSGAVTGVGSSYTGSGSSTAVSALTPGGSAAVQGHGSTLSSYNTVGQILIASAGPAGSTTSPAGSGIDEILPGMSGCGGGGLRAASGTSGKGGNGGPYLLTIMEF